MLSSVLVVIEERGPPDTGHAPPHWAGLLAARQAPLGQLGDEGGDKAGHPLGALRQRGLAEFVASCRPRDPGIRLLHTSGGHLLAEWGLDGEKSTVKSLLRTGRTTAPLQPLVLLITASDLLSHGLHQTLPLSSYESFQPSTV